MSKMKNILIPLVLCIQAISFAATPVQISFRPAKPEAGESVRVTITANTDTRGGAEVILPKLPPSARWNYNMRSDSTRMSMTNSGQPQISYTFVRQLTVSDAGKLEIPPVTVRCGAKELKSEPYSLEVLPAGSRPKTEPESLKPFGKLFSTPERPLRPGEKITLHLELYIPENFELLNISLPALSGMGNAVLQKDPATGKLVRQYNPVVKNENGNEYVVYPFTISALTAISGDFFPQAEMNLTVRERRNVSRDDFGDDIFNSFFGRSSSFGRPETIPLLLKDQAGFKVVPLPPLPAGAIDLGLTGTWQCSAKFSTASCRSGEVAELEISLIPENFSGNLEEIPLKVPELKLDGFRVYPPETIRKNGRISIRYAMVPLSVGEKSFQLKLAWFDTIRNVWQLSVQTPSLAVTPGSVNQPSTPAAPAPAPETLQVQKAPEKIVAQESLPPVADGLSYLKADRASAVKIPLIANQKILLLITFGGGILLLIFDLLARKILKNRPAGSRKHRRETQKRIKMLCRELEKSSDLAATVEKFGVAEIAELSGLDAGATAQDIADRITDADLKEFFSNAARSSFAPGVVRQNNDPALRKKLLKFLKRLTILLLLLYSGAVYGNNFSAANAAFDRGDYAKAAEEYRRALQDDQLSVSLLYNLGCTEFKLGNYPEARVWFSRAKLLAPGDLEVRANLKLTEEKLQLAPADDAGSFTSHLTSLRDSLFRPDQYLAAAGIGFFMLCLIIILRGCGSSALRWSGAGVLLFMIVLALLAALGQADSSYSPSQLILTGKSVELRSLPVENSGTVLKKIAPGFSAVMVEKRGSWLRIVCDDTDGWIHETQAMQVFPYGIL
jgi:tetratricopeptide (TPR) repeat protein